MVLPQSCRRKLQHNQSLMPYAAWHNTPRSGEPMTFRLYPQAHSSGHSVHDSDYIPKADGVHDQMLLVLNVDAMVKGKPPLSLEHTAHQVERRGRRAFAGWKSGDSRRLDQASPCHHADGRRTEAWATSAYQSRAFQSLTFANVTGPTGLAVAVPMRECQLSTQTCRDSFRPIPAVVTGSI